MNADDISGNGRTTEGRVIGAIKRIARGVASKLNDLKSRCFDETENI